MPLQDVIDADELADEVLAYCAYLVKVLSGRGDLVTLHRHSSGAFNAEVRSSAPGTFHILLFDGLVAQLRAVLESLDSESIDDEMRMISRTLLGGDAYAHLCYRIWLVESLIFVVLHEVAHVLCGHFDLLRAISSPSGQTSLRFTEIRNEPLQSPRLAEEPRWRPLMELEADEVALDRMLAIAYELFCADESAKELLGPERTAPEADVPEEHRRRAEELTFYAAATSMALIEAHGGSSEDHPPAFARMFNLVNTYARRLLTQNAGPPGIEVIRLTDSSRHLLSENILPALFNAMDIAESCCTVVGVDLAERFGIEGGSVPAVKALTADLVAMLTGRPASTLSSEGARYDELRRLFGDFHRGTAPYRMQGG